jgi:hypothetical protein
MNINKAHRLITRQLEVFTARKSNGGEKYTIACQAVDKGSFRDIELCPVSSKTDKVINR